jgi:hypothetical protein
MTIEVSDARPLLEVRRTTLLSDGSVAQHFRDGRGTWDTVVHPPGSMVANKYIDFVDYAEEE